MTEPAVEQGRCPLCRSPKETRVWVEPCEDTPPVQAKPDGYNISDTTAKNGGMAVQYCAGCGFGWNNDPRAAQRLEKEYSSYTEQREYLFEGRNRIGTALRILSAIAPGSKLRPGTRLLDIGASVGYYTKAAGLLGYDAIGVEPSPWAAEYGSKNLGVNIIAKSFFDCAFDASSFDVVLLADVLEHTTMYRSMLESALACLKPAGVLVIVTPDIDSLAARWLGRRWWSLKPEHVVYFSKRSLTRVLTELGCGDIKIGTVGRTFSLPYWLYLLTGRGSLLKDSLLRKLPFYFNFADQMLCLCVK